MWYENLFEQLELQKDEEQGKKMSAYMQNKFDFLGIPKPKLKDFVKPYLSKSKKLDFDWAFVFLCWDKPYREAQYIAIEYILMKQKQFTDKDLINLKKIITEKSWWETVDSLDAVVGTIVAKYPEQKQLVLKWSVSDNIWLRRIAIDFQQKYKDKTDTELLSRIIENNFGSDEFFINKAIGWSLRDYSKVNAEWVKDFLERFKNDLATLSIKEASKYL
jgi:3-methyladenine DNA glycosylase AlkD